MDKWKFWHNDGANYNSLRGGCDCLWNSIVICPKATETLKTTNVNLTVAIEQEARRSTESLAYSIWEPWMSTKFQSNPFGSSWDINNRWTEVMDSPTNISIHRGMTLAWLKKAWETSQTSGLYWMINVFQSASGSNKLHCSKCVPLMGLVPCFASLWPTMGRVRGRRFEE